MLRMFLAVIIGVYSIVIVLNCQDLWDFVLQLCLTLESSCMLT